MSRESKFTFQVLKDIIHKYRKENNYVGPKLSFSEIARFAQEKLGIEDIEYYHFSRNKEINDMVKKYKTALKSNILEYSGDDSYFAKLDVKEFVKNFGKDEKQLTFMLSNLQESLKNLYDRVIDYQFKYTETKNSLDFMKKEKEKYREKCKLLTNENKALKEEIKTLELALNLEEEKQLLSALNSTGIYEVDVDDEKIKDLEDIKHLDDNNGSDIEKIINDFSKILKDN